MKRGYTGGDMHCRKLWWPGYCGGGIHIYRERQLRPYIWDHQHRSIAENIRHLAIPKHHKYHKPYYTGQPLLPASISDICHVQADDLFSEGYDP